MENNSYMDFNDIWRDQMESWHNSSGKTCRECWADKESASKYLNGGSSRHQERVVETIEELPLKPDSRVLDIGSGPGILAVPMALKVKHVTTVEPSPGMNEVMADFILEKNIKNITCVKKKWEDVDIESDLNGPFDIIIASMSLGMSDIRVAIEKMEQAGNGHVYLYWHAGTPGWEKMPRAIWPKIYKKDYSGGPKSDVLFQVLYHMGIYPEIRVVNNEHDHRFETLTEAVTFYASKYNISDKKYFSLLEDYLRESLVKENNYYIQHISHKTMKFWWKTGECNG